MAHLQEYASEDVHDSLQSDSDDDDGDDDGAFPGDSDSDSGDDAGNSVVRVYVAGNTVGDECVLAREVSAQNAARAAGESIANVSMLSVFTCNATYQPVGGHRVNWGVQFLMHATELLQDWGRRDRIYSFLAHPVPVHDWTHGSMFDHAVGAGRLILAPTRYHTVDRSIATPLLDFSPAGRHAAQIQAFKDELQLSSPAAAGGHASNPQQDAANHHQIHNDTYARASIFFLLTIIPELFHCELPPSYPAGIAQLHELKAQFSLVPPAFSTREYVERALRLVDHIAVDYNRFVFADRVITFEDADVPGGGKLENHIAPRAWVVMQIIQMRQKRMVHDNGPYGLHHTFNRCVSNTHRDREDRGG